MRDRRIFFALAGVLLIAELIILGFCLEFRVGPPETLASPSNDSSNISMTDVQGWTIDSPQPNEGVPRRFLATGRCGSLPAGSHVIMAVQTGRVLSPMQRSLLLDSNTAAACEI
jgi:hypothetical protein